MRRAVGVLLICAVVAGGVAQFVKGRPAASAGVADSATAVHVAAADADGVRPVPGLGPVLDDLSQVSAPAAAALFAVESRLFTRLDSASAADFGCDEAMPSNALLAAHARVLDASAPYTTARLEITSVGRASLVFERGCKLEAATLEPGVRIDTVTVVLERSAGALSFMSISSDEDHGSVGLAGPMRGYLKADWARLTAQADSIRASHGQPPARMLGPAAGRYAIAQDGSVGFPRRLAHCAGSAIASATTAGSTPRLAIAPEYFGGIERIEGEWLSLSESEEGACITPLVVTSAPARDLTCQSGPPRPSGWYYRSDSALAPVILVRDVAGARVGAMGAPYTQVPGRVSPTFDTTRADRVHVFHGIGEVLRVAESERMDGAMGPGDHGLVARFGGRTSRLPGVVVGPTAHWAVFWVGLLNADTIPDLIVRVQRPNANVQEHEFDLLLSAPDSSGHGVVWQHGVRTWLTTCR